MAERSRWRSDLVLPKAQLVRLGLERAERQGVGAERIFRALDLGGLEESALSILQQPIVHLLDNLRQSQRERSAKIKLKIKKTCFEN